MTSPESLILLYSAVSPHVQSFGDPTSKYHDPENLPNLLDQNKTEALLRKYDIASTGMIETDRLHDIEEHMKCYTAPYIMKVAGSTLVHKTEL